MWVDIDPTDRGRVKEIVISAYNIDKYICPTTTTRAYIKRTSELRGNENQLLISFVKPHIAVGTAKVARWVSTILALAGIDTKVFRAHSTRSAATSHTISAGLPLADILKTGDWASAATFQRFYNRPVVNTSFVRPYWKMLRNLHMFWTFPELEVLRWIIVNYAKGTYLEV